MKIDLTEQEVKFIQESIRYSKRYFDEFVTLKMYPSYEYYYNRKRRCR